MMISMISDRARFRVKDHIIWKEIGDEIVFLNMATHHYYSLNDVGVDVWHWIREGKSFAEVVESCFQNYEGDREEMKRSIEELIRDLLQEHFIEEEVEG